MLGDGIPPDVLIVGFEVKESIIESKGLQTWEDVWASRLDFRGEDECCSGEVVSEFDKVNPNYRASTAAVVLEPGGVGR